MAVLTGTTGCLESGKDLASCDGDRQDPRGKASQCCGRSHHAVDGVDDRVDRRNLPLGVAFAAAGDSLPSRYSRPRPGADRLHGQETADAQGAIVFEPGKEPAVTNTCADRCDAAGQRREQTGHGGAEGMGREPSATSTLYGFTAWGALAAGAARQMREALLAKPDVRAPMRGPRRVPNALDSVVQRPRHIAAAEHALPAATSPRPCTPCRPSARGVEKAATLSRARHS